MATRYIVEIRSDLDPSGAGRGARQIESYLDHLAKKAEDTGKRIAKSLGGAINVRGYADATASIIQRNSRAEASVIGLTRAYKSLDDTVTRVSTQRRDPFTNLFLSRQQSAQLVADEQAIKSSFEAIRKAQQQEANDRLAIRRNFTKLATREAEQNHRIEQRLLAREAEAIKRTEAQQYADRLALRRQFNRIAAREARATATVVPETRATSVLAPDLTIQRRGPAQSQAEIDRILATGGLSAPTYGAIPRGPTSGSSKPIEEIRANLRETETAANRLSAGLERARSSFRELETFSTRAGGKVTGVLIGTGDAAIRLTGNVPKIQAAYEQFFTRIHAAVSGDRGALKSLRDFGVNATAAIRQPQAAFAQFVRSVNQIHGPTQQANAVTGVLGQGFKNLTGAITGATIAFGGGRGPGGPGGPPPIIPGGGGGGGAAGGGFLGALGAVVGYSSATAVIGGLTATLTLGGRAWIEYASKIQNARIAFATMLGGVQNADAHLRELQQFALTTPFQFAELVDASQRMQALGIEAKEVVPLLTDVGNAVAAAGGGGERLARVIKALTDVRAKERLQTQEIRQFAEAGISAYKILAEQTGKTVRQIQDDVEAGKVSADLFFEAFQRYSKLHFGDLMAQQAKTFTGAMSNIYDVLLQVTERALNPFFTQISQLAYRTQQELQKAINPQQVATVLQNATAELGGIIADQIGQAIGRKFGDPEFWKNSIGGGFRVLGSVLRGFLGNYEDLTLEKFLFKLTSLTPVVGLTANGLEKLGVKGAEVDKTFNQLDQTTNSLTGTIGQNKTEVDKLSDALFPAVTQTNALKKSQELLAGSLDLSAVKIKEHISYGKTLANIYQNITGATKLPEPTYGVDPTALKKAADALTGTLDQTAGAYVGERLKQAGQSGFGGPLAAKNLATSEDRRLAIRANEAAIKALDKGYKELAATMGGGQAAYDKLIAGLDPTLREAIKLTNEFARQENQITATTDKVAKAADPMRQLTNQITKLRQEVQAYEQGGGKLFDLELEAQDLQQAKAQLEEIIKGRRALELARTPLPIGTEAREAEIRNLTRLKAAKDTIVQATEAQKAAEVELATLLAQQAIPLVDTETRAHILNAKALQQRRDAELQLTAEIRSAVTQRGIALERERDSLEETRRVYRELQLDAVQKSEEARIENLRERLQLEIDTGGEPALRLRIEEQLKAESSKLVNPTESIDKNVSTIVGLLQKLVPGGGASAGSGLPSERGEAALKAAGGLGNLINGVKNPEVLRQALGTVASLTAQVNAEIEKAEQGLDTIKAKTVGTLVDVAAEQAGERNTRANTEAVRTVKELQNAERQLADALKTESDTRQLLAEKTEKSLEQRRIEVALINRQRERIQTDAAEATAAGVVQHDITQLRIRDSEEYTRAVQRDSRARAEAERDALTNIASGETYLANLRNGNAETLRQLQTEFDAERVSASTNRLRTIYENEDRIAHAGEDAADRYRIAWQEAYLDVIDADTAAAESRIRSEVALADAVVYHEGQANARVLEFLAQQKSVTDIVSDARIDLIQEGFNGIDRVFQKLIGSGNALKRILSDVLSNLTKLVLSRALGPLFGGGGGTGGGGILGGVLGGFGGGGGGGGAYSFAPSAGGGPAAALAGLFGGGRAAPSGGFFSQGALNSLNPFGGGFTAPTTLTAVGAASPFSATNPFRQLIPAGGFAAAPGRLAGLPGGLGSALSGAAGLLPLLGAGLGIGAGSPSRGGSILGGIGGGLAGLGVLAGLGASGVIGGGIGAAGGLLAGSGAAAGSGGLFGALGLSGISTSIGTSIGGPLGAFASFAIPAAAIALPLIVGAIILGKNAARRRDERARNQLMLDSLAQLNELLAAVKRDRMDGQSAITTALEIRNSYIEQAGGLRDSKTRRIALTDVSRLDSVIGQIRGASDLQARQRRNWARIVPEFHTGGEGVIPKANQGLMSIPGVFDGRDDMLMRVSRGEHVAVMTPTQYSRLGGRSTFAAAGVPALNGGGQFGPGLPVTFAPMTPTSTWSLRPARLANPVSLSGGRQQWQHRAPQEPNIQGEGGAPIVSIQELTLVVDTGKIVAKGARTADGRKALLEVGKQNVIDRKS